MLILWGEKDPSLGPPLTHKLLLKFQAWRPDESDERLPVLSADPGLKKKKKKGEILVSPSGVACGTCGDSIRSSCLGIYRSRRNMHTLCLERMFLSVIESQQIRNRLMVRRRRM